MYSLIKSKIDIDEFQKKIDQKMINGNAGKLAGMVVGIKDNLCYKNHKVTAGSKMLKDFESLFTATSVQRLLDELSLIHI